jgi:hypothetical protein
VVASAAVVAGGSAVEVQQITSHRAPAPAVSHVLPVHKAKPPVPRAAVPTDAALGPKAVSGATLDATAPAAGSTTTAPATGSPLDPAAPVTTAVTGTGGTEAPAALAPETPMAEPAPSDSYSDPTGTSAKPGGTAGAPAADDSAGGDGTVTQGDRSDAGSAASGPATP